MLYREIITVCSEIHKTHRYTVQKMEEFLMGAAGGTYIYQFLNDLSTGTPLNLRNSWWWVNDWRTLKLFSGTNLLRDPHSCCWPLTSIYSQVLLFAPFNRACSRNLHVKCCCLSVWPSLRPYISTLLQVFSPLYFSGIHLHKFQVTAGRVNIIFSPICIAKLTAVIMVTKGDHPSVETVIRWPLLRPSYSHQWLLSLLLFTRPFPFKRDDDSNLHITRLFIHFVPSSSSLLFTVLLSS
jgi:hypothetical protein